MESQGPLVQAKRELSVLKDRERACYLRVRLREWESTRAKMRLDVLRAEETEVNELMRGVARQLVGALVRLQHCVKDFMDAIEGQQAEAESGEISSDLALALDQLLKTRDHATDMREVVAWRDQRLASAETAGSYAGNQLRQNKARRTMADLELFAARAKQAMIAETGQLRAIRRRMAAAQLRLESAQTARALVSPRTPVSPMRSPLDFRYPGGPSPTRAVRYPQTLAY